MRSKIPESVGFVLPNKQMKIIDENTGATLGPNQIGEIFMKTPLMMMGYYKNPEATSELFDKDGIKNSYFITF